jgi:hypothetical protein
LRQRHRALPSHRQKFEVHALDRRRYLRSKSGVPEFPRGVQCPNMN